MKKQNDHLSSCQKIHHFNTHAQHLRRIMQILSQNLFNQAMVNASASLSTLHFGLWLVQLPILDQVSIQILFQAIFWIKCQIIFHVLGQASFKVVLPNPVIPAFKSCHRPASKSYASPSSKSLIRPATNLGQASFQILLDQLPSNASFRILYQVHF